MKILGEEVRTARMSQTVPDLATLEQRLNALLPEIGKGVVERERDRILPFAEIAQFAANGLFNFRIPVEHGGAGASVAQLMQAIIRLASVDSNMVQALRPGFGFLETLLFCGSDAEKALWFERYRSGEFAGNAILEIGGAHAQFVTRVTKSNGEFKANGRKYYSTGAIFADWVSIVALDEKDELVFFDLPRDREGLQLLDDFDAMGQRLTGSGTTILENVTVLPEEFRVQPTGSDKRTILTPFLQLYLAAVEAGIAQNALADAIDFAKHHARPIVHSTAERSVDDPYVQCRVGEIAASAYAAEAAVARAAVAVDRAWQAGLAESEVEAAAVEVAKAQVVAVEAALRCGELIFDVGSASATSRKFDLDRHWRNARTIANHNPRDWKCAALGAYHLTGANLPLSGFF